MRVYYISYCIDYDCWRSLATTCQVVVITSTKKPFPYMCTQHVWVYFSHCLHWCLCVCVLCMRFDFKPKLNKKLVCPLCSTLFPCNYCCLYWLFCFGRLFSSDFYVLICETFTKTKPADEKAKLWVETGFEWMIKYSWEISHTN